MHNDKYTRTDSNMDFNTLKVIRKGKNIRQGDLAKSIGITQTYLSLIESNKRIPSITIIEDICKELDCELRIIPKT